MRAWDFLVGLPTILDSYGEQDAAETLHDLVNKPQFLDSVDGQRLRSRYKEIKRSLAEQDPDEYATVELEDRASSPDELAARELKASLGSISAMQASLERQIERLQADVLGMMRQPVPIWRWALLGLIAMVAAVFFLKNR